MLKMRKTTLLIGAACILCMLMQSITAEEIISINLIVYENDSVKEDHVIVSEGRPTRYYQKPGDYTLQVLDGDGNTIWSQKISILFGYTGPVYMNKTLPSDELFNNHYLSFRIPYSQDMRTLTLLHGDNIIYSKSIVGCNRNNKCEDTETYYSCPQDCPLESKDNVCVKRMDNACDPDCGEGVDPDCSLETTSTPSALAPKEKPVDYLPYIVILFVIIIFGILAYRKIRR